MVVAALDPHDVSTEVLHRKLKFLQQKRRSHTQMAWKLDAHLHFGGPRKHLVFRVNMSCCSVYLVLLG